MSAIRGNKVTKQRGHKTHGWGSKKKHRGKGSKGGSGKSGWKHRKLMFIKQGLKSKSGVSKKRKRFKSLKQIGMREPCRSINISDLLRLAEGKKEISLKGVGYGKLLGRGSISRPLTVKAAAFSAKARQKIEGAGGKAIEE
jgi:large subunit ribosomal protein L15